MSIATDARSYADLAVAQGKTALAQASQLLVAANRRLIADAPKPAYAAIGAADLVAATVTKRVEDLPVDAVTGVSKAQQTSQALLTRAQSEANAKLAGLRNRVEGGVDTVTTLPSTARTAGGSALLAAVSAGQAYVNVARSVYGSLTDRGEAKAAQLQQDPRVAKLLGQLSDAGESVAPAARSAFDDVTTPVATNQGTPARPNTPARTSTASKTAAAKTSAAKASATKSPARKAATTAPATRSSAKQASATRSSAKQAPARKSDAAKAPARKASARKAPAKKA